MRFNRSLPACVVTVIVLSAITFWLPVVLIFDLSAAFAGYAGGHLGGSMIKGAISGLVGGFAIVVLWALALVAVGEIAFWSFGLLGLKFVTTVGFGAIGGIGGRAV